MSRTFAFAAVAALALAGTTFAQNDAKPEQPKLPAPKPLTVGDPARAIDIEHWIKGDEITEFKDGKIYVVEFWATWCGPCRASMPHITKLQGDYKDYGVTFIGVSDEELDIVTEWLGKTDKKSNKTWSEVIGYTLATDPDLSVKTDYMVAAGQGGIPTAFIIGKDQHIEWIGHPMDIDKALEGVVKDNWDRAAFKTKWEKSQAAEKDFDTFMTLLLKENKPDEAYKIGAKVVEANWDNAMMLNGIAWTVVDNPGVQTRNLDFALKAAKRANELTHDKDSATLDTLARVYYEKGDLKEAVKVQKRAVENVQDENMAAELKKALEKYEAELAKKS